MLRSLVGSEMCIRDRYSAESYKNNFKPISLLANVRSHESKGTKTQTGRSFCFIGVFKTIYNVFCLNKVRIDVESGGKPCACVPNHNHITNNHMCVT